MVDLLGKFGLLDEAMIILNKMSVNGLEVHASVWGASLGACRMHKNVFVAEIAGEKILELEPSNSGVYMILAEIFLASGRKQEAYNMWIRMKEKGVKSNLAVVGLSLASVVPIPGIPKTTQCVPQRGSVQSESMSQ
ncbi:hypothetical protein BUALT_Bualt14G0050800 [Buddleja alternifolia]|uniref:Pentatricopeptide repeat-containing protein n=1 Tax=Buddleja alternifolia TaxID=168488 RepID=A0AAV6WS42_9LAMI|nr:hypothetical protein BUALT_Bualt14G0050800 [Buddleja alternifolia]